MEEKTLIKEEYPPNFQEINQHFNCGKYKAIFAYGNTIYNPYKVKIYPDNEAHEKVHFKQQKQYTTPDIWWTKYLLDKDFRKDQEVEAYNQQWLWVKENLPAKASKEALNEFSQILSSSLYDLGITSYQAETLIRKYGE